MSKDLRCCHNKFYVEIQVNENGNLKIPINARKKCRNKSCHADLGSIPAVKVEKKPLPPLKMRLPTRWEATVYLRATELTYSDAHKARYIRWNPFFKKKGGKIDVDCESGCSHTISWEKLVTFFEARPK